MGRAQVGGGVRNCESAQCFADVRHSKYLSSRQCTANDLVFTFVQCYGVVDTEAHRRPASGPAKSTLLLLHLYGSCLDTESLITPDAIAKAVALYHWLLDLISGAGYWSTFSTLHSVDYCIVKLDQAASIL